MNRIRWLAVIGTVGMASALTGCGEDKELRKYLAAPPPSGPGGEMYKYLDLLSDAVCQLEEKDPTGLATDKRICPGGPGDKVKPPTYPP